MKWVGTCYFPFPFFAKQVAVSEGRRIFSNLRKFVIHLLTGNVAEASDDPPPPLAVRLSWSGAK